MPHLSQLQRDYQDKNVTIIGLTSADKSNTLEQVKAMTKKKGDGMNFSVAWDVERKTNEAYMQAANQRGIPASFLVDKKGNIAWIGHPMNVDIPLAYVVGDKWDYVKGPEMMKAISDSQREISKASKLNPKEALELLTAFTKAHPLAAKGMDNVRFTILSALPDQADKAKALGRKIVDKAVAAKDAMGLNQFAWNLVDPQVSLNNRFLELAMLAATKANEFTENKDGAILDTLARVHFRRGELEKAIEIQTRAVENASDAMKPDLEKALGEYKKALGEKQPS